MSYFLDSVYWHVAIGEQELLRFRGELQDGSRPQLAELMGHSPTKGYDLELRVDDGLRVEIARETQAGNGLYIIAGPRWLRSHSPDCWEAALLLMVNGWGFSEGSFRLSRVDLAVDVLAHGFPEVDPRTLVSRGRRRALHWAGQQFSGLSVGTTSVAFRMYDKVREAHKKNLPWWLRVWGLTRLVDGETVVRFEWQLRKDALRQFGVVLMGDWLQVEGDVLRYLLDWVKLAGPPEGHDHQRPDLPMWAWLRKVVGGLTLGVQGVCRYKWRKVPKADQLAAQAVGVLATMAAVLGYEDGDDGPKPFSWALEWAENVSQGPRWADRFVEKFNRVRFAAAV